MIKMELYKHVNGRDVALMPLSIYYSVEREVYKIKCRWFNIVNPNNMFDMNVIDRVEIKAEAMKDWKKYEREI